MIVALFIFLLSDFNRTNKAVIDVPLPKDCLNQKIPYYAKSLFVDEKLNSKKVEYSFIAAGHIYGSHGAAQQGRVLPATTLVNNISLLKSLKSWYIKIV